MATIQFAQGLNEITIPDVRLTRSRSGESGTATFVFIHPQILEKSSTEDITGMYLVDEEGELVTREVKARFVNGKPEALEAIYVMKSAAEWDRFIRFMDRYAEEHGLELSKS
jgi:photosystem II protein